MGRREIKPEPANDNLYEDIAPCSNARNTGNNSPCTSPVATTVSILRSLPGLRIFNQYEFKSKAIDNFREKWIRGNYSNKIRGIVAVSCFLAGLMIKPTGILSVLCCLSGIILACDTFAFRR
ncbi:hypothetical protein M0R72_15105 [Candidatus Pacearchaeota archaeon]|jgi:hypothetical protein|nr:hypothetical protein [Candidatus Pacearchaeota archaeon]